MKILPYLISFGCKIHQIIEKFKESLKNVQKMKKKCIIKVVTGIGNQGQLPWLAYLGNQGYYNGYYNGYYDGYYDGYHNQPWLPRLRNRLVTMINLGYHRSN